MTWIEVEGFEVYGDDVTAGTDVETALNLRPSLSLTGTRPTPLTLEDNDQADGTFALTMPTVAIFGPRYNLVWEFPSAFQLTMDGSGPTFVVGMRVKVPTTTIGGGEQLFWQTMKTPGSDAGVRMAFGNNGNDLVVRWGSTGATSSTAVNALTPGAWTYIECEYYSADVSQGGFVNADVDGVNVVSSGTVTTDFFLNTHFGMLFRNDGSGGASGAWALDDVCLYEIDGVDHTAIIGDRRVVPVIPNADATPNDWTPSTGSDNYAMIDEDELDVADYVTSVVTGDDEHYTHAALSASTVDCLQIDVECIATSGTPTLHVGISDGTNEQEANDGVIGTGSNAVVRKLFDTQPDATAWDAASLNAVEQTQRATE